MRLPEFASMFRQAVAVAELPALGTGHGDVGPVAVDSEASSEALSLTGIHHRFDGVDAVADVSLSVAAGEVVCLLGPSGCGKTTLLRIAAGLERLQRGQVRLGGELVASAGAANLPPEQRSVGLMFQDSALFPHLTVLENVLFGLDRWPQATRRQRALALLEQLRMSAHAQAYPHMLSGGQQQRVALARALAPAPRLMLLDEPFSALDARLRDQIRDDTLHALKDSNTGTLLVTHDPEEAMFMADRIAIMKAGRILQIGPPVDLYCRPAHPFVATFFGDVNRFDGVVESGQVRTPVGLVDAPGLAEGERAKVLIRPEALQVQVLGEPCAGHDRSHVVMSRLLGRSSLTHLCVHDDRGCEYHLHARMPGVFLPQADQPIALRIDHTQVFVFPWQSED
jgi:iron(III) transport system ATP-binding protein